MNKQAPQVKNLLVVLLLTLTATSVHGQETGNPTLASDWLFRLGGAVVTSDPEVGLGAGGDDVSIIDLDQAGVDTESTEFHGAVYWQGLDRWRFGFTTYASRVDGELVTKQDQSYGDLDIPAGSGVVTDVNSTFYILHAHYAFMQREDWELNAGVGIYALDWDSSLGLRDGGSGNVVASQREDFLAPLPTLNLTWTYAFNNSWATRVGVDWLKLSIGDYDGEVLALTAGLDWWISENWGLSAGVSLFNVDVEVEDQPFNQYVEAEWSNLSLSVQFAF